MSRKQYKGPEDYPHDRITTSVRKGYKRWLRKAADELNLDVSKLNRFAIEDWINAHSHLFSDELRKEMDHLRKMHGGGHWSDLL